MTGDENPQEAPGDLEVVRAFVNTIDVEAGTEGLATPSALTEWLREQDLIDSGAQASENDLARAVEVRAALRAALLGHAGGPVDEDALEVLTRTARAAGVGLRFASLDEAELHASGPGVVGGLGRILVIAAHAMAEGTWERLKVCLNDECGWAFYDHARNKSAKWCSMAVCGNRMKVRAFRARRGTPS
jgi:predicted RNA-binding Zn ribbon-like protein